MQEKSPEIVPFLGTSLFALAVDSLSGHPDAIVVPNGADCDATAYRHRYYAILTGAQKVSTHLPYRLLK
jgi:hypothetical protein